MAFRVCAYGDGWRKNTPAVVLAGCFLYPPLIPLWNAFARLARGRDYNLMSGDPMPLKYRDMRDAAERCNCSLPVETVEELLITLDEFVLERARDGKSDSLRDD